MATVIDAGYVKLGSFELPGVTNAALAFSVSAEAVPDFDSGGHTPHVTGLDNWTLDIEANQDYSDNGLDETIWGMITAKNPVAVEVRKDKAAVSASNPKYTGTGVITAYNPIAGSVGDVVTVSINVAEVTTLTRATS